MRLTRAQRHLLNEGTESQRNAMQILLAVGLLADAPRLVPITSAHVSGVAYQLIGGPAALAAAVVGATPEYGLHTHVGREPTGIVKVGVKPKGIDYSLIGLVAGERVGDGLPFFRGFRGTEGDLKWLGAALASSGACSMF